MARFMVVGGYGNAGAPTVRMLLEATDAEVIVAGRNGQRADDLVAVLDASDPEFGRRLSARAFDARDSDRLTRALADVDLVILAAGLAPHADQSVRVCCATGTDYIDMQVSGSKVGMLRELDADARAAGVTVVTDGGFHPGLPAAMVRRVATRIPGLTSARVGSVISIDWGTLGPLSESTVTELMAEFRHFAYEEQTDGQWHSAGSTRWFEFPAPFGRRKCAAMGLAEMHELTASHPQLRDAGFYVGGFNPVVDRGIIPIAWAGMRLAPRLSQRSLGRLLLWGLIRFSRPPYGTVLQVDGATSGTTERPLMRVTHPDGYVLTAAPVVATAKQMLEGGLPSGVHLQATVVDPARFFADLAALGVTVADLP